MRNVAGIVSSKTLAQIAGYPDIVPFRIVSAAEDIDIIHVVPPSHARLRPLGFGAAAFAISQEVGARLAEP
jgi:hypothetical protein